MCMRTDPLQTILHHIAFNHTLFIPLAGVDVPLFAFPFLLSLPCQRVKFAIYVPFTTQARPVLNSHSITPQIPAIEINTLAMKALFLVFSLLLSLSLTNALAIPAADSTDIRLSTRNTLASRALCGLGKNKNCKDKGKGRATTPVANAASPPKKSKTKAALPKSKAGPPSPKIPPARTNTPTGKAFKGSMDVTNPRYFEGSNGEPVYNLGHRRQNGMTAGEFRRRGPAKPKNGLYYE